MTISLADRIKQTSITSGSGAISLSGNFGGFQGFSVLGNNAETFYALENESRWEVGVGTYSGGTLTRDSILDSSAGGSKVNLDGVSTVFCVYPATRAVYTDASGNLDLSGQTGLTFPTAVSFEDLTVSGNLTIQPYSNGMTNFIRSTSGNFFQAYVDDTYDRTIALYSDATSSPQWRLGIKSGPTYPNQPPTYAYFYGEDGDVGMVSDATCSLSLKHSVGFNLTHQSASLISGTKAAGITIGTADTGTSLDVTGSGSMTALTVTSGVVFADGLQSIAFTGYDVANYASGQVDIVSADLLIISGIANAHTADYAVDILANTASGTAGDAAVSGWVVAQGYATSTADFAIDILANTASGTAGDAAVSGWVTAQGYISSYVDTNTTYTGGSGLTLVGTTFHAVNTFSQDIIAVNVSGAAGDTAVSGWVVAQGYISSYVDTNTTYTAGDGMVLVGTEFAASNTFDADILAVQNSGTAGDTAVSGYFAAQLAGLPGATDYSVDILANTASGTAGDAAVSGWVVAQGYLTIDSDTTYTGGSGITLQGGVFHAVNTFASDINAVGESGVAASGYNAATYLTAHPNISAANSVNNPVRSYIQDITLDSNGHITAITSGSEDVVDTDTTYTAGSGMALVGTVFHFTDSGAMLAGDIAVSGWVVGQGYLTAHPSISASASVNNSGRTYIQDITLDSNGHITAITSATETVTDTNTDTTYTAGSGLTLIGTEFNTQGSGNFEGLIVEKAIKPSLNIATDGATVTFNMNDSNRHMVTLAGNRTVVFDNVASGQPFAVRLRQDGTGSRTITWPANIKWENDAEPTLSSIANHADWIGFICTAPSYYDGAIIMSGVR